MRPSTTSCRLGPLYVPLLEVLEGIDGLFDWEKLDLELELELVERLDCESSPWTAVGEED